MDDVTALRDALVNDAIWVNANTPKNVGEWRARLDALIAAVEARAALTTERCPAAVHHRVRTFNRGGMVGVTVDGEGIAYAPDDLVADRCTACGFDFLAALATDEAVP